MKPTALNNIRIPKKGMMAALTVGLLLLQACSSRVYNNEAYLKQHPIEGKKIAILPVDVELTGRLPKGMTNAQKMKMEEDEGKVIQSQLYSQYLYKSKKESKKRQAVELINVDQVNSILSDKGIGTRASWNMNPDSLGRLLGADLVLKVRVKKDRIMSDAASLGIGVATSVLDNLLSKKDDKSYTNSVPTTTPKTYNMLMEATLTDAASHAVITRFTHNGDTSWNNPPEKVIAASGRKIVRKGVIYARN